MKERPTYEPLPDNLVRQAASTDLAAYLTARGEQLIPADNAGNFRLPGHDTLYIKGKRCVQVKFEQSSQAVCVSLP